MRFFAGGHSPLQLLGRLFGGSGSHGPRFLGLPSGYVKIAIENDPFIVLLPMNNGDFP